MPPKNTPARGGGGSGGGRGRGAPAARGAGRGGAPVARAGAPAPAAAGRVNIASHVETVGVKRPNFGTGGRPVRTWVNAFPVTIPDGNIYHYDVAVTPDTLPARANMDHFKKLHEEIAAQTIFKGIRPVYDGRKNAYTVKLLPLVNDTVSFDIPLGAPREGRPPKVVRIKLTLAAVINTQLLHGFIDGTQTLDSGVYTSIAALNVSVRMEPNQKYTFNTRSFFTPNGSRAIGGGMELWRGYFQSIRPTANQMYVNLDIATGIMYRAGPLINLALEFFGGKRDPNVLSPAKGLPDRERLRLQRFLANVRVKTTYGGRDQIRVIKKLSVEGADKLTFKREDKMISVADYFKKHANFPLKFPNILCIETASGGMFPFECCDVLPGQIMRKQLPSDKTTDVVEFSKMKPGDRLRAIKDGFNVLNYGQSDYVREFGMVVDREPLSVMARVLDPPTLRYGSDSRQPTIRPSDGAWNMKDKRFYRPMTIGVWAVIIYESYGRFGPDVAKGMVEGFVAGARSVGMKVDDPNPLVVWHNGQGNIADQLRATGRQCLDAKKAIPTFFVVVLPEGGNDIYTAVKHFGDVVQGIATQCLKAIKCRGAKMQYWANVMLKVNVKLDGINSVLDRSALADANNPTIIMGADAVHPAPGAEARPSFTALVSSVDSTTAKYVANISVQTGRKEIIEDLEEMCKTALGKYRLYQSAIEKNSKAPTRLIFYRDGVSEGQFQQVLDEELPRIQNACRAVGIKPKITLIIVGKRHHIRMFPQSNSDMDRSENCRAGTTIDQGIGHPTEFDYYQLSHGGLLGTSRPAHYSVIYDENNFTADAMQNVSFALCHVYARATRSVSIPAPVYYADIVCARAKNHFSPTGGFDLSETATVASSQNDSYLESYRRAFGALHNAQSNRMYFM